MLDLISQHAGHRVHMLEVVGEVARSYRGCIYSFGETPNEGLEVVFTDLERMERKPAHEWAPGEEMYQWHPVSRVARIMLHGATVDLNDVSPELIVIRNVRTAPVQLSIYLPQGGVISQLRKDAQEAHRVAHHG